MSPIRVYKQHFVAKVTKIPNFVETTKTIRVSVEQRIYDSKYKRYYKKTRNYMVHYEPTGKSDLKQGDFVKVYNCRRISPRKSKITDGKRLQHT